ncbi:MAG: YebC/PmpR family DNA-binding transcriptional regulator [Pirellulales bacterium]
MAGHSHWANISRKKAIIDHKRGKVWSRLSKAIIVAAKAGGGDPDMNLRLRYAIDDAKAISMPKENIQRAVSVGIGELDGGNLDEVFYEGYGPAGVAVMCEILTDNRNRTAPEIRKIFELNDGNLGATGCVGYLFERKGIFVVLKVGVTEDRLMEVALEAGADDVTTGEESYEIVASPSNFTAVSEALKSANITTESAQISRIPTNSVDIDDAETAQQSVEISRNSRQS